jgi:HAMP domain-containing protein
MRSKQLLYAAAALLGMLLLGRLISVESDIAVLRADLANRQEAPISSVEAPRANLTSMRAAPPTANPTGFEGTLEELQKAKDRIGELEGTVSALSDAWNKFAAQEEARRAKAAMRGWGPEQATGAPDTPRAGDQVTAWASAAPDGGVEWLQTDYERPVEVSQIRVLESEAPGAVVKIAALTEGGGEIVLWQGSEPRTAAPADQMFAVPPGITAQSIRVYLDTAKVPGWNEIDAVELIGRDGSRQWAKSASASSTYAQRGSGVTALDSATGLLLR